MISIHQSQFLPWIPYFFKVLESDNFIVMDDVQFQKNGVQNRNMIKTPQGEIWLTIPVKQMTAAKINEVCLTKSFIYEKLLKTVELNYKKSLHFEEIFGLIQDSFDNRFESLHELNNSLLRSILSKLKTNVKLKYTSDLKTVHKKDDLVIEIIEKVGDYEYLSGSGGLGYMDLKKFKEANIKVFSYSFDHMPYPQLWDKKSDFVKNLSIIDLLFNDLENARNYIKDCGKIIRVI